MALKGIPANTEQTRGFDPMLSQCWASVEDDGPTLTQQWAMAQRIVFAGNTKHKPTLC